MDIHPIRVLLVEDDEDDYIIVRDLLLEIDEERFRLDWVTTYDAAFEAMVQNQHDVYLVDYVLGEKNGVKLLDEALKNGCKAPIIVLTGRGDRDVDMAAMRSGAADYLDKSQIKAPLLERSIRYAIERKRAADDREQLVTELQEALARVKQLSGMLPICASCKKIRDDKGYWKQIETYIRDHSEADFSHSICPECAKGLYAEVKKDKE
jgi:DNA-binding response OmpR family regulator